MDGECRIVSPARRQPTFRNIVIADQTNTMPNCAFGGFDHTNFGNNSQPMLITEWRSVQKINMTPTTTNQ